MPARYDIVGYTYSADFYCPEHVFRAFFETTQDPALLDCGSFDSELHAANPEGALDCMAAELGIDREDERTFDSGDFPKVVFRDQLDGLTCPMCPAPECPGHADDEDCEIDPQDPCAACRAAGDAADPDQAILPGMHEAVPGMGDHTTKETPR